MSRRCDGCGKEKIGKDFLDTQHGYTYNLCPKCYGDSVKLYGYNFEPLNQQEEGGEFYSSKYSEIDDFSGRNLDHEFQPQEEYLGEHELNPQGQGGWGDGTDNFGKLTQEQGMNDPTRSLIASIQSPHHNHRTHLGPHLYMDHGVSWDELDKMSPEEHLKKHIDDHMGIEDENWGPPPSNLHEHEEIKYSFKNHLKEQWKNKIALFDGESPDTDEVNTLDPRVHVPRTKTHGLHEDQSQDPQYLLGQDIIMLGGAPEKWICDHCGEEVPQSIANLSPFDNRVWDWNDEHTKKHPENNDWGTLQVGGVAWNGGARPSYIEPKNEEGTGDEFYSSKKISGLTDENYRCHDCGYLGPGYTGWDSDEKPICNRCGGSKIQDYEDYIRGPQNEEGGEFYSSKGQYDEGEFWQHLMGAHGWSEEEVRSVGEDGKISQLKKEHDDSNLEDFRGGGWHDYPDDWEDSPGWGRKHNHSLNEEGGEFYSKVAHPWKAEDQSPHRAFGIQHLMDDHGYGGIPEDVQMLATMADDEMVEHHTNEHRDPWSKDLLDHEIHHLYKTPGVEDDPLETGELYSSRKDQSCDGCGIWNDDENKITPVTIHFPEYDEPEPDVYNLCQDCIDRYSNEGALLEKSWLPPSSPNEEGSGEEFYSSKLYNWWEDGFFKESDIEHMNEEGVGLFAPEVGPEDAIENRTDDVTENPPNSTLDTYQDHGGAGNNFETQGPLGLHSWYDSQSGSGI